MKRFLIGTCLAALLAGPAFAKSGVNVYQLSDGGVANVVVDERPAGLLSSSSTTTLVYDGCESHCVLKDQRTSHGPSLIESVGPTMVGGAWSYLSALVQKPQQTIVSNGSQSNSDVGTVSANGTASATADAKSAADAVTGAIEVTNTATNHGNRHHSTSGPVSPPPPPHSPTGFEQTADCTYSASTATASASTGHEFHISSPQQVTVSYTCVRADKGVIFDGHSAPVAGSYTYFATVTRSFGLLAHGTGGDFGTTIWVYVGQ